MKVVKGGSKGIVAKSENTARGLINFIRTKKKEDVEQEIVMMIMMIRTVITIIIIIIIITERIVRIITLIIIVVIIVVAVEVIVKTLVVGVFGDGERVWVVVSVMVRKCVVRTCGGECGGMYIRMYIW